MRLAMGLWLPLLPFAFGGLVAAWAQPQMQVPLVYSTRRDAPIVAIGERDLPRILEHGLGRLDYYSEYIDDAEPSVWDRNKVYILAAAAVLGAQSLLIAGLLLQRRMRRQAEARARGSEVELRGSYGRIRDLAARLLQAQDTERSRVARELHDDVSQQVALLSMNLERLLDEVPREMESLVGDALNQAQDIARNVHDLSHRLHPMRLRLTGLVAALDTLQRELSRSTPAIAFTHQGVPHDLPSDLTLSLFRVVQEALQNAVKYSRAGTVTVDLRGESDALVLTISDDGVGFDVAAAAGTGLGLISMNERIDAVGGTFDIRSRRGRGTLLAIRVPLARQPATASNWTQQVG